MFLVLWEESDDTLHQPEMSKDLSMLKRWLLTFGIVLVGALLVIQLVPYGRNHANPPIRQEPQWNSPDTRELTARACFDCHSNQTAWPWYSNIAPASWLIQRDVDKGRRKLNFSEWDRPQEEAAESAKSVQRDKMPPWYYPWAQLSAAEQQALITGLEQTLGTENRRAGSGKSLPARGRQEETEDRD
jgi:hypothetical protein